MTNNDGVVVKAVPSATGGIHQWAQALYDADLRASTGRLAAQQYLTAVVRPIDLTLLHYQWDGATPADLDSIRRVLQQRRLSWLQRLTVHECRDIYPLRRIEDYSTTRQWFGRTLDVLAVAAHLRAVADELRTQPKYEVALVDSEELYFNYVIQDNVVLLEGGSETMPEPPHRLVAGVMIDSPEIANAFRDEFERLWARAALKRTSDVVEWFELRASDLESRNTATADSG